MKHQKQGDSECFLASVAMLADKPLEEVKARAKEITGLPWLQVTYDVGYFWSIAVSLCETYKLEKLAHTCKELRAFPSMGLLHQSDYARLERFTLVISCKLQGKGHLGLYWFMGGPLTGHSVVFENGKLYDPNAPGPLDFLHWAYFAMHTYGDMPSHVILTEEKGESRDEENNNNLRV